MSAPFLHQRLEFEAGSLVLNYLCIVLYTI
jgi:hypothetical protein